MLASITYFIYNLLIKVINIYSIIWFIWIIMGWLNNFGVIQINSYNTLIRYLRAITEGVLNKVFGRYRYKMIVGRLDLAPLVFLLILTLILPTILGHIFLFLIRLLN